MEPIIHKMNLKGQFETSDATPTTSALENSIADMFSGEEGVIRVSCRVSAYNKAFYGEDYYFGSETTYMYNQHGNNEFDQIDSSSDTTYSEVATSALSFSLDDTNDVISMAYTGEAGEAFVWKYEAEIELFVGSLQDWLDLYLTFQIFDGRSGVANLSESIEINGTTVSPTFRYYGGNADATSLTAEVGTDLPRVSVGVQPDYNDGSPLLGDDDDSVKFVGSDYYKHATADGQVTTEDFVVEIIFKYTAESKYLVSTYDNTTGYMFRTNATALILSLYDSGGNISIYSSALTEGCWYHALAYVNRDENSTDSSHIYINAIVGPGYNCSAINGTLAATGGLTVGARADGSQRCSANLAYASMWKYADLFSSGATGETEAANLAAKRFAQVSGRYPQVFTHDSIIVDGDMEAVGVGDWTASNAILTKESGARTGGSGTLILRITRNGGAPLAYQGINTVGIKYRIVGWARGDGTRSPAISSSSFIWQGTSSTSWQSFDITYIAASANLALRTIANAVGYVEFDDVTVTRVDELPIVATRAYEAYLDKIESDGSRKLYYVGSEWLRQCHRNDGTNDVYGYLPETASTNQVPYSEELDDVAWTKTECTIDTDAIAAPNDHVTADGIIASSTPGNHTVSDAFPSGSGTDTISFWAKKGSDPTYGRDWVRIYYNLPSAANCYFDLDHGTVGTETNCTGYIEDWGNDWFRCIMVISGNSNTYSCYLYPADDDGDSSFTGDDSTPNIYVWGVMYEQGMEYCSSYIPTSGGTSTRLADQLRHKGDDGNITDNQQGTMVCGLLLEDYDNLASKYIAALSDGGVTTDRIAMLISATSDVCGGISLKTAGNTGSSYSTGDCVDGGIHAIRMRWEDDYLVAYRDGVPDASPDTSCDMPDDLDRIDIGMSQAISNHTTGLIENLRIYNIPTTKG